MSLLPLHTRHEPAAPTGAGAATLYAAIEISRKSRVVGLKSSLGEKIGLHTLGAADVERDHFVRCAPWHRLSLRDRWE